jgi:AraC-like DNA-binding protein
MQYVNYIPAPPLNAYIDDLYYMDGPSLYPRLKVLPMPSLHLMVNFGDAFRVYEANQSHPVTACTDSWAMGLFSTYHIVDWPLNIQFFGVHFKPGGVYPFLGIPLSELPQVVPLDAIWGCFAAEIRERLYATPTIQAGFALLERLLLARLCPASMPYGLDVVQYAITKIERRNGALSIAALSDHIGISQKHLGTHFKQMVGVLPKELARFYRFAHVLDSIDPTKPTDWTQLVHQCGYHDQSHLYKEFVAFTGHSPTDYLAIRHRTYDDNPEQAQLLGLGQMPVG